MRAVMGGRAAYQKRRTVVRSLWSAASIPWNLLHGAGQYSLRRCETLPVRTTFVHYQTGKRANEGIDTANHASAATEAKSSVNAKECQRKGEMSVVGHPPSDFKLTHDRRAGNGKGRFGGVIPARARGLGRSG